MATQLLVNVLRVPAAGNLAPGAQVTLAHGLKVADVGVVPTLIEPGGATNIVVLSADDTNVTFKNNDLNAGFAEFRVYFDHSIIAEAPVTPLWWNGITGSTSPSGAAGGDLSGFYPNPTVAKIQGNPVVAGTPLAGADLEFTAGSWTPTFRYNSTITQLYVDNATGNDANDGLTLATAKKTIQAAVNVAGLFVSTGATGLTGQVTINIAAQTTTENVDIAAVSMGNANPASGVAGILFQGAPQTVLAGPFTLTAVSNADPDCPVSSPVASGGACTITAGAAAWTPSAYKGKFVRLTSGATSSYAPIIDNTATVLTIVRNTSGATGYAIGNTVEIVEPSTVINGQITIRGVLTSLVFNDISIAPTANLQPLRVDSLARIAANMRPAAYVQRCRLISTAYTGLCQMNALRIDNSYLQGNSSSALYADAGCWITLTRTYATTFAYFLTRNAMQLTASGAVFENFTSGSANEFSNFVSLTHVKFKGMGGAATFTGLNGTKGGSVFNYVLFYSAANTITHLLVRAALMPEIQNTVFVNGALGLYAGDGAACYASNYVVFSGCTSALQIANGAATTLLAATFLAGITTGIEMYGGTLVLGPTTFSATTNPVVLRERSLLATRAGVTGTGNAANPTFKINDGSRLVYTTLPAVTGGSTDFSFDGTTKNYADLPYFNTLLSGAAIRSA